MNELKSYTEYAVSTPTADFVIGFDFNYGEDAVNVTVDDVPATTAGYTVVYLNETTIRLSPSVPSGVVRLQRETDIDQSDHTYRAGAKFIAQTIDENFEQIRYAQQEVRDGFSKLKDDIGFTNLEQTVQAVTTIANEVEDNVTESRTLLVDTTDQAVLAQGYANSANSANTAAQQAASAAQQAVVDVSTAEADVYSALSAQQTEVNNSLTAIAGGHKAYQTLALAQADQTSLPTNTVVEVTNDGTNNGTYQWNGTTLTKSAYDPLTQAKSYTDTRIGELINSPPTDIFNSINKVTGSYINKSGVQTSSASWSCSGFLPVKYRDVIIYNASANNVVAFIAAYDANRAFLRELVSTANSAVTVLNGQKEIETDVKFIRVSFYTASSTTYSFQYKPFEFETDMLNKSETSDMVYKQLTAPVNLFDPTLAKDGYALINNVETVTAGWLVSDYIPVISNETYTANGSGYKDPVNRTGVHYFDDSKLLINTTDTAQRSNAPFSVPSNAKFMRINFVKANSPTISNIVVSRGMVATKSGRLEDLIESVAGGGTANRYSGKTLMTFGDSITDHVSTAFTYPPIVADYFGMSLFDPAMSGSRVRSCFYSRPTVASNANILASHLITIAHGTNDFKLETPLGVITDTPTARATLDDATYNSTTNTTGTFCADYKGIIESILTINPNARIMLITPIRRTQTPGEGANSLGHTLLDYVNAIKDIAKLYSLPILDNHSSSGFNLKTIPTWTSDGLHPTEWAQRNVMAQKIIGFIESN